MKPRCDISKFSKGRLVRAVAVLFLLHTGADLVFPQLCNEEPVGISMNQSLRATDDGSGDYQSAPASLPATNESGENPRREESPREEDCFCCCTHVMPSSLFVDTSVVDANLGKSFQPHVSIISAPLNTPDRPPRFA